MAEQEGPVTSADLAKAMRTNPVVIRRIMAGLRSNGCVRSEKGHGGGWTLARALSKVTLRDVYQALGCPSLLGLGNRTEAPSCLMELAVNAALDQAFRDAESVLLSQLAKVTLAELTIDFRKRLGNRRWHHDLKTAHPS
jgi:DNA-binding IscR family transcriptional regulator